MYHCTHFRMQIDNTVAVKLFCFCQNKRIEPQDSIERSTIRTVVTKRRISKKIPAGVFHTCSTMSYQVQLGV